MSVRRSIPTKPHAARASLAALTRAIGRAVKVGGKTVSRKRLRAFATLQNMAAAPKLALRDAD